MYAFRCSVVGVMFFSWEDLKVGMLKSTYWKDALSSEQDMRNLLLPIVPSSQVLNWNVISWIKQIVPVKVLLKVRDPRIQFHTNLHVFRESSRQKMPSWL